MSRIGEKPIEIADDVKVRVEGGAVVVSGALGELTLVLPDTVEVKVGEGSAEVTRKNDSAQARADHGTIRSILDNMIIGVKEGYIKELELVGMGYRASLEGQVLVLTVGWNHPVKIEPPEGISFEVADNVNVVVKGIDKQLVGLTAAKIREVRKPEPYKGKGIKYADEIIRRKTSKAVKEEK